MRSGEVGPVEGGVAGDHRGDAIRVFVRGREAGGAPGGRAGEVGPLGAELVHHLDQDGGPVGEGVSRARELHLSGPPVRQRDAVLAGLLEVELDRHPRLDRVRVHAVDVAHDAHLLGSSIIATTYGTWSASTGSTGWVHHDPAVDLRRGPSTRSTRSRCSGTRGTSGPAASGRSRTSAQLGTRKRSSRQPSQNGWVSRSGSGRGMPWSIASGSPSSGSRRPRAARRSCRTGSTRGRGSGPWTSPRNWRTDSMMCGSPWM